MSWLDCLSLGFWSNGCSATLRSGGHGFESYLLLSLSSSSWLFVLFFLPITITSSTSRSWISTSKLGPPHLYQFPSLDFLHCMLASEKPEAFDKSHFKCFLVRGFITQPSGLRIVFRSRGHEFESWSSLGELFSTRFTQNYFFVAQPRLRTRWVDWHRSLTKQCPSINLGRAENQTRGCWVRSDNTIYCAKHPPTKNY